MKTITCIDTAYTVGSVEKLTWDGSKIDPGLQICSSSSTKTTTMIFPRPRSRQANRKYDSF